MQANSSIVRLVLTLAIPATLLLQGGCDRGDPPPRPTSTTEKASADNGKVKQASKKKVKKKKVAKLFSDEVPAGLPPMPYPEDNLPSPKKIALGKKLFFDPILSADKTISCSSCHDPNQGWADGRDVAEGIGKQTGERNSISIANASYNRRLFWDGRAKSLEEQSLGPMLNKLEMGMESEAAVVERISSSEQYVGLFKDCFDDGITIENVTKAIACFERTILIGDSPYDRYKAGDKSAMSADAIRGMKIFFNDRKANCAGCHTPPLFTDNQFYNTGIGFDQPDPDMGFHNTMGWGFHGAFRSPSLRGVASTAPYMHDGSLATLEDVVDYYARGGNRNEHIDPGVRRLRMNKEERSALVTFLREGLGLHKSPTESPESESSAKSSPQSKSQ